ncbi:MAG: radical SAM protein [Treponema sp.]|jgi:organic radical activating enzyme|nr:radical SAM protein [Treponema sp.]
MVIVKFSDYSHHAVLTNTTCNYRCSYCFQSFIDKKQRSFLEQNQDMLINFLSDKLPAIIQIIGGEPALAAGFGKVIDALPQHKWFIVTNLSLIPEWYLHKNVLFIYAAYHDECTMLETFFERCKRIQENKKSLVCNYIVKPENEFASFDVYSKFSDNGIPFVLIPKMNNEYFSSAFIVKLINEYRTNLQTNACFFQTYNKKYTRLCPAGTRNSFVVNHDGSLCVCNARLNTKISGDASIIKPSFYSNSRVCTFEICRCMVDFFAGHMPVNDNEYWEEFIDTGVLKEPSKKELLDFVVRMQWDPAGLTHDNPKRVNLFDEDALNKIYGHASYSPRTKMGGGKILDVKHAAEFFGRLPIEESAFTYFGAKDYYYTPWINIPALRQYVQKLTFSFNGQNQRFLCIIQDVDCNMLAQFVYKGGWGNAAYSVFLAKNIEKIRLLLYPAENTNFKLPDSFSISSDSPLKDIIWTAVKNKKLSYEVS